jgi:hypothetical protein
MSLPPISGPPAPASPAPAQPAYTVPPAAPASSQYGQWARAQRPQGTVYGASAPLGQPLGPPLEQSGSLTGHILARGAPDVLPPKARTARVIVILGVALGAVVVISFVIAIFFRDTLNQLFNGFFSGT